MWTTLFVCFAAAVSAMAQTAADPISGATFTQATQGMKVVDDYQFGTAADRNIRNISGLASKFNPYGISGTTNIQSEWEVYQPFNPTNFVFTPKSLEITATIPRGGGIWPGGINSGQIASKATYTPGKTGHQVYASEIRMRIPAGPGFWVAGWFYVQQPGLADGSEIDNPEFMESLYQNEFDWTGMNHGPKVGAEMYSIKSNPWTWHPGLNFAADYHDYQTVWTPDAVYKYVDGTLVHAQKFQWTAPGAAQLLVTLAVGTSIPSIPGLVPSSLNQFPASVSVDHITIWAK